MKLKEEMLKTLDDIQHIVNNVVFRDTTILIRPTSTKNMIWMAKPCVLRDYDRKYPDEAYHGVQDFELAYKNETRWDTDDYYAKEYISNLAPIKKVDKLESWFDIPPLPIPKRVFLEFLIRFITYMELHELQENFYFEGERIFDPHGEYEELLNPKTVTVNW